MTVLTKKDNKYKIFSVRNKVEDSMGGGYYCYSDTGSLWFLPKNKVIAEFKYTITLREVRELYPEYFLWNVLIIHLILNKTIFII